MNTTRFISPSSRLAELDGIRGVAILLVLIWHYVALGVPIDAGSRLFRTVFYLRQSWCGVDLFFVLSGFLIGGILLDARDSKKFFKTFYIRRALRILPLYFCLLIAFSIGAYLMANGGGDAASYGLDEKMPIWTYWLLIQNIWSSLTGEWGCHWLGVTWSLAIEEQFYLTLPLLIRFTPRRILPWIIGLLIIVAPVLRTVLFYNYRFGQFSGYWLMPCRTDALGLGVMLAIVTRHKIGAGMLVQYRWLIQALFLLSSAIFIWLDINGAGVGTKHMATYGHTVLAIQFSSLLALVVSNSGGFTASIMRSKFLGMFGILAYGIYLLHYPVLLFVHRFWFHQNPSIQNSASVLATAIAFGLVLILSGLSWRFFEKPLIGIGHKHRY